MRLLLAMFVLLITGCAATGASFETPSPPPDGFATLIFYRMPTGYGGVYEVELRVDDRENVASINESGYTIVRLRARPKPYLIAIRNYYGIPLTARSGEVYYVRYAAQPGAVSIYGGVAVANNPEYPLNIVPADEALKQIEKYKHKLQPATVPRIE